MRRPTPFLRRRGGRVQALCPQRLYRKVPRQLTYWERLPIILAGVDDITADDSGVAVRTVGRDITISRSTRRRPCRSVQRRRHDRLQRHRQDHRRSRLRTLHCPRSRHHPQSGCQVNSPTHAKRLDVSSSNSPTQAKAGTATAYCGYWSYRICPPLFMIHEDCM